MSSEGLSWAYQLQAAVAAVHADALDARDTDWQQIVEVYDQLLRISPTAIVRLNRSIALAETGAVASALDELSAIPLDGYHLYHATRGDLLARLDRGEEARLEFERAVELTDNKAERRYLVGRANRASS